MGNISPQGSSFNNGIWRILEKKIRTWTFERDTLYIVTTPILKDREYQNIGRNQVTVL
ncbi:DNA/RNA non-specific endonuclease [candidate division KSB1 bacterium]|nr:DNA/RNA non-specific endonuclease [candidate division KSB1 bacterium]